MVKNMNMRFNQKLWMSYLTKHWLPIGLGLIMSFILRELLMILIVAVLVFAFLHLWNKSKKHTEGGKA